MEFGEWAKKKPLASSAKGSKIMVAGERSHCRYANLSSYFVIPNLTPAAA
jgi:hypothetical protein